MKEICFGHNKGICNILDGFNGKKRKCAGYSEFDKNGRLKKCSFYKTKKEFQKGFDNAENLRRCKENVL